MPKIKECGILLRGYAKTKPDVEEVVERIYRSVMQAVELGFGSIIALVPKDKDCGATPAAINAKCQPPISRFLIANPKGNENSDVLNDGLELLGLYKCTHAFIMSNKAIGYLTVGNVAKMLAAFDDRAFVVPLAVRDDAVSGEEDEVFRGVLEGRASNILTAWDITALNAAGNFDSKIGVEEIASIVRMSRVCGACIAPVLPTDQVGIDVSPLRAERWKEISTTKTARQLQEAKRAGGDFDLIKSAILPGYPK